MPKVKFKFQTNGILTTNPNFVGIKKLIQHMNMYHSLCLFVE